MATVTAIIETAPVDLVSALRTAWLEYQDADRKGLAFGARLYELRDQSSAQGNHEGKGFLHMLQQAGIVERTAYYWLNTYEISIGEREARVRKPPQSVTVLPESLAIEPTSLALPFTYEDNFLTPEEANEFEKACQSLNMIRKKNQRDNGKTFIRNLNLLYCDIPATHAEKVGTPRNPVSTAPQIIRMIIDRLSARLGRTVNYCSLMGYEGGKDHIGWHQHREDYGHNTPVAIVSTGIERDFSYRTKANPVSEEPNGKYVGIRHDIPAERGSLIILPSSFNTTHEHAVLDDKTVTGTRYSMNVKCMDGIYYGDTSPGDIPTHKAAKTIIAEQRAAVQEFEAEAFEPVVDVTKPESVPVETKWSKADQDLVDLQVKIEKEMAVLAEYTKSDKAESSIRLRIILRTRIRFAERQIQEWLEALKELEQSEPTPATVPPIEAVS